jgi:N-acetylglucosamine-6-phosphate deacetylase
MKQCFKNGKIIRQGIVEEGDLWCADGKFIPKQDNADLTVDLKGKLVVPGYIDIQINGIRGIDFTSEPESLQQAAAYMPSYGVTSFLPTVITTTPDRYRQILPQLQPRRGGKHGSHVLGVHLEGPFLNPFFGGAHPSNLFLPFEGIHPILDCYGSLEGVKIVTLAPELPNALIWIEKLKESGVVVSAGHTQCTLEEYQAGLNAGVTMCSHLFNAMTPFHHRSPGLVGLILSRTPLFYSIIADKKHVHPTALKMAWLANPEGLILVTDAISALGADEGTYRLGDKKIKVENGRPLLAGTTTLAGSVLSMDEAVRNLREVTGCTIAEAVYAATGCPAKVLGIDREKGSLDVGKDADFNVLDENLQVEACYISGEKAFSL